MKILQKCENALERDDPVYDKLEKLMTGYENIYNKIGMLIKKWEIIENFKLNGGMFARKRTYASPVVYCRIKESSEEICSGVSSPN